MSHSLVGALGDVIGQPGAERLAYLLPVSTVTCLTPSPISCVCVCIFILWANSVRGYFCVGEDLWSAVKGRR